MVIVTISQNTYGILQLEVATVRCGQRPQHSWVTKEPIRGQRPPQLLTPTPIVTLPSPQLVGAAGVFQVVFDQKQLWRSLAANRLLCDSGMLWPLATTNCGNLRLQNSVVVVGGGGSSRGLNFEQPQLSLDHGRWLSSSQTNFNKENNLYITRLHNVSYIV